MAFFDLCAKLEVATEEALWAKATDLSDQGDRALLSFLLESDSGTYFAKVVKAQQAKEALRRSHLTREQLLDEYFTKNTCSCATNGHCHALMKKILQKNGLDGTWQKEVLGTLRSGRAKMRNLCLLGPPDCAKSFLLKGLEDVYRTYTRPDGGSYQLEDLLGGVDRDTKTKGAVYLRVWDMPTADVMAAWSLLLDEDLSDTDRQLVAVTKESRYDTATTLMVYTGEVTKFSVEERVNIRGKGRGYEGHAPLEALWGKQEPATLIAWRSTSGERTRG